ncbi:hypothetical protein [Pelagibaculum spongiae]|uniref:Bacterial surface antigen (D15) domain-containing protein n=1 Tax=Pelagibaculum spongiae TaxID=2080658 RepID=A0A2V1GVX0_9GAMM|nr:hypothetical protein [Pelagibaculum spongiae]PVZ68797.1 hypothetical protein DC094_11100 [Pelagibaculum spongiae]
MQNRRNALSRFSSQLCATAGALLISFSAPVAYAAPDFTSMLSVGWQQEQQQWQTLNSEHFRIHFSQGQKALAQTSANIAEASFEKLSQELKWQPKGKIEVVLTDDYDISNGWATPLPFNQMRLFIAAPDAINSLEDNRSWLETLIVHELTHVIHLDKATAAPKNIRQYFGRLPLLFPNAYQPSWFTEGLAVHKETDFENGFGRGQSSYYHMLMRSEVARGSQSLEQVNVGGKQWPLGENYLYGSFFMQYFADTYSEAQLQQLIDSYSRNIIPFWLNPTARKVTGKDYPELWSEFQQWLDNKFAPQIAALNAKAHKNQQLTFDGLSNQPIQSDGNKLYFIENDGNSPLQLVEWQQGKQRSLVKLRSQGYFDVDNRFGVIIAQTLPSADNRFYSDLYLFRDGRLQAITDKARYREARWTANGRLIARSNISGESQLDWLDADGQKLATLWRGTTDEVLGEFDVHPTEKRLVAAIKRKGHSWGLEQFNIDTKQWQPLVNSAAIESQPKYSADGESVFFSADYQGIYNLQKISLKDQKITQISQVASGAFYPVQTEDQQLYYSQYTANGFDFFKLDEDVDIIQQPAAEASFAINFPVAATEQTDYSPWPSLSPRWWLPLIISDEVSSSYGVTTSGQDALGQHSYAIAASVDVKNEQFSGNLIYGYSNKYLASYSRSLDYYDINDVVEAIQAEDTLQLIRLNLINAFNDDFGVHLGASYQKEKDSYHRNDASRRSAETKTGLLGVAFTYNNSEQYLNSISTSWGRKVNLVIETNEAIESDFSGEVISYDWQEFFNLPYNQVLALRSFGSWGSDRPDPLTLGGTTSDASSLLFGRNEYALRGYDDNQFVGDRLQVNTIEWRFPITTIERSWNIYPIGLQEINGSLFVDSGAVWNRTNYSRNYDGDYFTGAGAELETVISIGFGLALPFKLGYAHGFDSQYGEDKIYLTIGQQF